MVRTLILAGIIAGLSAAVPAIHQRNPELVPGLLRTFAGGAEPAAPAEPVAAVRKPEPARPAPHGRKVRLEADARGHFIAEFRINGRRVEALVDTGATVVAINRSTAQHVGIRLSPADFVHEVNTANGRTRAAAATIERLEIGRILVENVPAAVLDDAALEGALIGMSFLKRLDRFEVAGGTLLLEQ